MQRTLQLSLLTLFLAISIALTSKKEWKPIGPLKTINPISGFTGWSAHGLGRIFDIAIHPQNSNKMWIASPNGGLFYTKNRGKQWNSIPLPCPGGITHCTARKLDSDKIEIIVASNVSGSKRSAYSYGIFSSINNGESWDTLKKLVPSEYRLSQITAMELINDKLIYAINDTLFQWYHGIEKKLTTKAGKIYSLKQNPTNKNEWFACGEQLSVTVDDGVTFKAIEATKESKSPFSVKKCDIAFGPNESIVIAHSSEGNHYYELNNNYDLVHKKNAYAQIDRYRAAISYDHTQSRFLIAGVRLYSLKNNQFTQLTTPQYPSSNFVHDDIRNMCYTPEGHLLVAHDGGISITENGGEKWFTITGCGLNITEVYDFDFNTNQLIMGAQDLSSYGYDWKTKQWRHFSELYGDGGSCLITDSNSYVMKGTFLQKYHHDQSIYTEVNTPIAISSFTPIVTTFGNQFYLADKHLWVKINTTWSDLSPMIDNNYTISSFIIRDDLMFLSKEDPVWQSQKLNNKLYKTIDGGQNWIDITTNFKAYAYREVSDLCFGAYSDSVIYACMGSFDSEYGDKNKVFISKDQGETWHNISYNLPNVPCNTIMEIKGIGLLVGTDCGIYILKEEQWIKYGTQLPQCPITKIKTYKKGLIVSTYGRGLWYIK